MTAPAAPDSPLDAREFRRCCAQFATGVAVGSLRLPTGELHGLTINSFTSVSLNPPIILVSIGADSGILDHFHAVTHFGLSFLREEQRDLSQRFATRGIDRFQGVAWRPGRSGAPLLDASLADLECRILQFVPAGDHEVVLAEAETVSVRGGRPLLYFNSGYVSLRE